MSLVVSASDRNKMSAQALATVMGPPLMLHSSNVPNGSEVDHAQPIAVLKYLLQIWPQPQNFGASGNVIGQLLLYFEINEIYCNLYYYVKHSKI